LGNTKATARGGVTTDQAIVEKGMKIYQLSKREKAPKMNKPSKHESQEIGCKQPGREKKSKMSDNLRGHKQAISSVQ